MGAKAGAALLSCEKINAGEKRARVKEHAGAGRGAHVAAPAAAHIMAPPGALAIFCMAPQPGTLALPRCDY